jgi:hypothetical protein
LRKNGALGVGIQLRPPRFYLYFETNREYGLTWYDIHGVVEPFDKGTRVVAHAGIQQRYTYTPVGLWVLAGWITLSSAALGILFLFLGLGLSLLYYQVDRRLTRENDPAASHLADRLDLAMATLAQAGP